MLLRWQQRIDVRSKLLVKESGQDSQKLGSLVQLSTSDVKCQTCVGNPVAPAYDFL